MVGDKVANLIIKIKNAGIANKESITFPYSKYTESILVLLENHKLIKSFSKKGKKLIKTVDIDLAYDEDGAPRVKDAERISKLSRRIYKGRGEIRSGKMGHGFVAITTSKGVMTAGEAKKKGLGGELLFRIWQ